MKNRILFALSLIVLILSSCQQDEFAELTQATQIPQISADQQAPQGAEEAASFAGVERQEFPKAKTAAEAATNNLIQLDRELSQQVASRSGVEVTIDLGSSDVSDALTLKCGRTTYGTTFGESNRYGNSFYSQLGLRASATGNDTEFIFEVTQPTVVDWETLFPASSNMIALLFAGDFQKTALGGGVWIDEHGVTQYGTPSYFLHLTFNRLVRLSKSIS